MPIERSIDHQNRKFLTTCQSIHRNANDSAAILPTAENEVENILNAVTVLLLAGREHISHATCSNDMGRALVICIRELRCSLRRKFRGICHKKGKPEVRGRLVKEIKDRIHESGR